MNNLKKFAPLLLLYFSANALFVYKYGARIQLGFYGSVLLYTVFLITALPFYLKFLSAKIETLKNTHFVILYFGILIFFVFSAVILLFKIDPYSIDVDRWSALHGFISYLFEGKYPYLARTHLGQAASPLPVMNFITIPFYLMGDVGYLQLFTFAFVAFVAFLAPLSKSSKILFMLAFLLSVR
ncbi:MAG: hypothetical protein LBI42_10765 [Chitinispirillales bacterium]|jgi:hypothetical protein|nr:hypothetical protein [Chitinispirillales bacterium]